MGVLLITLMWDKLYIECWKDKKVKKRTERYKEWRVAPRHGVVHCVWDSLIGTTVLMLDGVGI